MTEYFEIFLKYPTIFFILIIVGLILKKDKISFLFPSNEKALIKLLKSKENIDDYDDEILKAFITHEILKKKFTDITGLKCTENNKKLLELYKPIRNKLDWKEFKTISPLITNYNKYEKVGTKKVINKHYLRMTIFGIMFIMSIVALLFFVINDKQTMDLKKLNDILIPIFSFGACQIFFTNEYNNLKIIKKYDNIINQLITEKETTPNNV